MRQQQNIFQYIDWPSILLYLSLVIIGWINIYAAVYNDDHQSIFDISQNYGKQLIWIVTSIVLALIILVIDAKFYPTFSYVIYGGVIIMLILVLLFGREVAGSKSWFEVGSFRLQPAEFAKFATALVLAKYLSAREIKMGQLKTKLVAFVLLAIPAGLILLQNDTGSALVYGAFIFVLYREGLSQNVLIIGFFVVLLFVLALLVNKFILTGIIIGLGLLVYFFTNKKRSQILAISMASIIALSCIFSVDYVYNDFLKPHQKQRIDVLLGKSTDTKGAGYNVNQSLIAIGSGGFAGKGFLQGTQTKFDFVPEQSTDFIFCTVGEEWGFIGTLVLIMLFIALLLRIIFIAERQKSTFTRVYGYGVASILFFHFMINVGMTIGLAPVIGIPFPFLSYGGSSLWSFTILLFILLKLDSDRMYILK
ncbi:MAG: rod shape-determining protein RodA [Bacteroidia bacterium]|nr:rod shape-determining protein RodA [Bacteroidia bacterium]